MSISAFSQIIGGTGKEGDTALFQMTYRMGDKFVQPTLNVAGTAVLNKDFTFTYTVVRNEGFCFPGHNWGTYVFSFNVTFLRDFTVDGDKQLVFTLTPVDELANPCREDFVPMHADWVIRDIDFSANITKVQDGKEAAGNPVKFNITLNKPSINPIIFNLAYAGSTATAVDDYISPAVVTMPAGQTNITFEIPVVDDILAEDTEIIQVKALDVITPNQEAVIFTNNMATANILDNDYSATIIKVQDGKENTGYPVKFKVSLNKAAVADMVFNLDYTGVLRPAIVLDDYIAPATVTIPSGQTSITFEIPVVNDKINEDTETFKAAISYNSVGAGNVTFTTSTATADIIDNDYIFLFVKLNDGKESSENNYPVKYKIRPTTIPNEELRFVVQIGAGGTAELNKDFTFSPNTDKVAHEIIFSPGVKDEVKEFEFLITDDTISEDIETIILDFQKKLDFNIDSDFYFFPTTGAENFTANIEDNDNIVRIVKVQDGKETAGTPVKFKVTLDKASATDTTFNIAYGGNATGVDDYTAPATVTVSAGTTSTTFEVLVVDDILAEDTETISATISYTGVGTMNIATATVTASVEDNDNGVRIVKVQDGKETAGTPVKFKVTLDKASATDTTFNIAYGGNATGVDDYTAPATVTVSAGTTSTTFEVLVVDDILAEDTETISATISYTGVGTMNIATATVTASIEDNEPVPSLSLSSNNSIINENSQGSIIVIATLSGLSSKSTIIELNYSGTAYYSKDYSSALKRIVIPANTISGSFEIKPVNDLLFENDENVIISISTVSGGAIKATGQSDLMLTIVDDENLNGVKADFVGVEEGKEGSKGIKYKLTLDAVNNSGEAIRFSVVDTFKGTAISGLDYEPIGLIDLIIPSGSDSAELTVNVYKDGLLENKEDVKLEINNLSSYNIHFGEQTATSFIEQEEVQVIVRSTNGFEGGGVPTLRLMSDRQTLQVLLCILILITLAVLHLMILFLA